MLYWIKNNKEWLFSGVGVALVGLVFTLFQNDGSVINNEKKENISIKPVIKINIGVEELRKAINIDNKESGYEFIQKNYSSLKNTVISNINKLDGYEKSLLLLEKNNGDDHLILRLSDFLWNVKAYKSTFELSLENYRKLTSSLNALKKCKENDRSDCESFSTIKEIKDAKYFAFKLDKHEENISNINLKAQTARNHLNEMGRLQDLRDSIDQLDNEINAIK